MAASYKFLFNRLDRLRKDNTAPIHLRVVHERKVKYLNTGINIEARSWSDKDGGTIVKHRKAIELNKQLRDFKDQVTDYEIECRDKGRKFDPAAALKKDHEKTFLHFMEQELMADLSIKGNTKANHLSTINSLEKFGEIVEFNDLTVANIEAYDKYLREERSMRDSSRKARHIVVQRYINKAIKLGHMRMDDNPYLNYTKPKAEYSKRKFLSREMLDRLIAAPMPSERLEIVKDMFLFSCYTGMAYVDVKNLKRDDFFFYNEMPFIIKDRTKTEEESSIPLLPQAAAIIEKYLKDESEYLLPITDNSWVNKDLKVIQETCGIEINLTYHVARHTFATTITLENGVPLESVSKMLGHNSIKTTEIYAKITRKKLANDMNELAEKL